MSLYEQSLLTIIDKYDLEYLAKILPEDILIHVAKYKADKSNKDFILEKLPNIVLDLDASRFFRAISNDQFYIADKYIDLEVLNQALWYVRSIAAINYLITLGANDLNYGMMGAIVNKRKDLLDYFIELE